MSREDPRIERTRRKVLAAAFDVLNTEGPAAVTHQRVAEAAGVARATMYLHWPDRGALLFGAVSQLPTTGRPSPSGDLRADLVAALDVMRRLLEQPPIAAAFLELLAQAELQPPATESRRLLGENADTYLRSLLGDGVAAGRLGLPDIDAGIDRLLGPLVFRRLVRGVDIDDEFSHGIVDEFLDQHRPER